MDGEVLILHQFLAVLDKDIFLVRRPKFSALAEITNGVFVLNIVIRHLDNSTSFAVSFDLYDSYQMVLQVFLSIID
ncbi:hypothetical protein ABKN59_003619 [Abortiporus biennis]